MAATNKSDLLDSHRKEFDRLIRLVGDLDSARASIKDEEDTSIKDVIAHRAHWIALFFGWYRGGQSGETVHFPAKGYKWSDIKRYNADLRARQAGLSWPDALAMLNTAFLDLDRFIEGASEEDLYGGPMKGAKSHWTPGRWAEAAGPSHFRSASKYVRAALKRTA